MHAEALFLILVKTRKTIDKTGDSLDAKCRRHSLKPTVYSRYMQGGNASEILQDMSRHDEFKLSNSNQRATDHN